MFVQEYLLSILVQFKMYTTRYHQNIKQISETHSKLCETCMMESFCENNEQLKEIIYFHKRAHIFAKSLTGLQIRHWSTLQNVFHTFYFSSSTKTLLNKTVGPAQLTKFQNFNRKRKSSPVSKYLQFPGSSPNIKRKLFSRTSPGTLLL